MNKLILKIAGIIGVILLVFGIVLYGVFPLMTGGPVAAVIGTLLIIAYVVLDWKNIRESVSVRSAKYGTNTFVFVLVVFLIVCLLYIVAGKYRLKFDATVDSSNSLTSQSLKVISNLKDKVQIFGFVVKKKVLQRQNFRQLCDLYNYASQGKITCRLIEPDEHPALSREFGVNTKDPVYGFMSGEKKSKTRYLLEEDFTSALIKIIRDHKKIIYFVSGHGEGNIESDNDYDFKKISSKLRASGYVPRNIFLPEITKIPDECNVLVIISPKTNFMQSEVDKINDYLNRGGSVLLMMDPTSEPALDKFLDQWGLAVDKNIIVDSISNFDSNPVVPLVRGYQKHPITQESYGTLPQTYFVEASSVRKTNQPSNLDIQKLFSATGGYKYSYGETNIDKYQKERKLEFNHQEDIRGPLDMAYIVTKKIKVADTPVKDDKSKSSEEIKKSIDVSDKEAKLIVIGDSDFANNLHVEFAGNGTLFFNMINWLAGDDNLISINRPPTKPNVIRLTNSTKRLYYYLFLFLIPGVIFFTGAVIWWKKRK
ncbi:MAG: Gldg family protein [Cyanobacteriota bacterium]